MGFLTLKDSAYISLGANLGDRMEQLRRAVALLKARCLDDVDCSVVIETAALLPPNAPASWDIPYLNAIVRGTPRLSPEAMLEALQGIEREMGRPAAREKWAPRAIDLDIILWGDEAIDLPGLKVPHPEQKNRPFLLHLLAMLDPALPGVKTAPEAFQRSFAPFPRLVGVVNVTPDSFSDGGLHFSPEAAVKKVRGLSLDGAAVVEIGAQSTRPGAEMLSEEEEYARLAPVLEGLKDSSVIISLDSFRPGVIRQALDTGAVDWVNDVTGRLDDATLRMAAERGCKAVMMHALSIPPTREDILPEGEDPVAAVMRWGEATAKRLEGLGYKKEDIVLDPGIGFGKSAAQSLALMRRIGEMRALGCPVMAGHSRKSWIASFFPSTARERDVETIAASLLFAAEGIEYIRVHDIQGHQRALVAQQAVTGRAHGL